LANRDVHIPSGIIVPRFVLIGYFIFQNSTPSSFSRYLNLLLPFSCELR